MFTTKRGTARSAAPGQEPLRSPLTRTRIAATLFFGLAGFLFAGWAVRLPAIKAQVHSSPGALGLALLCMTGSAVLTMMVMGPLCRRIGSRRVTVAAAILLSFGLVPPTLVHSAWALGLTLLFFGVGYGGIDVAVNSAGVELITALDRPIMPSFHAANSFGSLAGAGLGGLLASYLSPNQGTLVLMPIGLLVSAIAGPMLLAHPLPAASGQETRESGERPPRGEIWRRLSMPAVTFGLIALGAAYCQGSLDNWVPLHITDDLGASAAEAAAGYAIVQGTLGIMRLCGTALLTRLGHTRVMTLGGLLTCAGGLLVAFAPSLPLAYAGLAFTGIGLANIFPTALARAGTAGGPGGIALAATLGYCGILAAPPSIGLVADATSLPVAMVLIPAMAALAAVVAYLTRPRGTEGSPTP